MDSSVPLLTPFRSYSEWKLKMIASLKIQDLYEVSIGLGKESYENEVSTSLNLLNAQRISGQNWTEPLERIVRIIIALWRE